MNETKVTHHLMPVPILNGFIFHKTPYKTICSVNKHQAFKFKKPENWKIDVLLSLPLIRNIFNELLNTTNYIHMKHCTSAYGRLCPVQCLLFNKLKGPSRLLTLLCLNQEHKALMVTIHATQYSGWQP
jgi:hypothetical protein